MKKAMTLYELMITLIIVGILVAVGTPSYLKMQEHSYDQEAIANLRRLQEAENIYYVELKSYYPDLASSPDSNIDRINTNLKVRLPYDPNPGYTPKWNYAVYSNGCARAARNVAVGGRSWRLRINEDEPISGICP